MKASDLAKRAAELVDGDRAEAYGDCLKTHEAIAAAWTNTLTLAGMKPEKPLDAHVVAWLMADLKKVRSFVGPFHQDSYVDGVGYISIAGEIKSRTAG
jgi:hypothetical protein